MRKVLLLLIMVMVTFSASFAQERNVSGKVISAEDNEGIPGVNVVLKGTSTGAITDVDGNYTIKVPSNSAVLVFSFVGLTTQEVTVGSRSVVDVSMAADISQLEEVVVTAFGVEREKKALGYSVQEVGSKALAESGADNVLDGLNGKVAGVQITRSSGAVGSASNINIRGVTSLIGDNQALIVVDGVRLNNDANYTEGRTAGTSQASGLNAINPADIESVSVLKGAAATALYGTAGATGVVVITTKKGSKGSGIKINYNTQVGFDKVSTLPELQTRFAQGTGGNYRAPETGTSGSWGPLLSDLRYDGATDYPYDRNGRLVLASDPTATSQRANVYDNVGDFYQTGVLFQNSISMSGGNDIATFRASISNLDQEGIIPNNTQNRTTFNVGATLQATEKLKFAANVNYTIADYTRIQQGSNTSGINLGLFRTPPSFDNSNGFGADAVDEPSAYIFPDGAQRNYRGGGGYDNPFWIANLAQRLETNNRVFGSFVAEYEFSPWAKLSLNVGRDHTSDFRVQEFEIGSRTAPGGRVINDNYFIDQTDAYLRVAGGGSLSSKINFNYFAGINLFNYRSENVLSTGNSLALQGFVNLANAATVTSETFTDRYRTIGLFGSAEFSYDGILFWTLTGRQDYDTRLSDPLRDFKVGDIAFFYPSTSLAFIFSELVDIKGLSFGKIRASWAQVGAGPPSAYATSSPFVTAAPGDGWGDNIRFPLSGVAGFEASGTLGNRNLVPETTTSIEIGADLRFLDGRIGLDVAYFNRKGEDLILSADIAPSTGYLSAFFNSGGLTTNGTEAILTLNPIRKSNFNWNVNFNFTRVISKIDDLAPGLERLQIGGFTGTGIFLVAGNNYGSIFGGAYLRQGAGGANDDGLNIPEGPIVINETDGIEEVDGTLRAIGDTNADFFLGIRNTFSYKRFNMSFLIDWKQGGDLWNGTNWALSFFGASQLTADTRLETPAPRPGVFADGTANNIPIVRDQSYWQSRVGGFGAVDEQFVQDAGWVRLRELSFSYSLDPSLFGDSKFIKGVSVGFIGRNLWFTTKYDGVDPETSLTGTGNSQGLDYFNQPSTRSFLFNVNVDF